MTFDAVCYYYTDNDMKRLPPACAVMFLAIARHTFGHIKKVRSISTKDIMEKVNLTPKTARKAAGILVEEGIIEPYSSSGGRGRQNEYIIREDYYTREKIPSKKNLVKIGAVSSSEIGISLEEGNQTPSVLPSASPRPRKVNKKTPAEIAVKNRLWSQFETRYGHPFTNGTSAVQAKSIWELIERAQGEIEFQKKRGIERGNWEEYLDVVIAKFFEIHDTKPKDMECVWSHPPLPNLLNSAKIWPMVVMKLPKVVKEAPLTEAQLRRSLNVGR